METRISSYKAVCLECLVGKIIFPSLISERMKLIWFFLKPYIGRIKCRDPYRLRVPWQIWDIEYKKDFHWDALPSDEITKSYRVALITLAPPTTTAAISCIGAISRADANPEIFALLFTTGNRRDDAFININAPWKHYRTQRGTAYGPIVSRKSMESYHPRVAKRLIYLLKHRSRKNCKKPENG